MKTIYLKSTDNAIMQQDLLAAGLLKEVESDGVKTVVVSNANDVMVDVGVILKPTGKIISENGFNIPEMKPIADEKGNPYYHINFYSSVDETPELKCEVPAPKNPYNVLM